MNNIKNESIQLMTSSVANRRMKDCHKRDRLEQDLRKMILNNELDCINPISTEMELGKTYGLSRNTVRKALQTLTDEGLLYKRHGRGTFIIPPETRSPERVLLNKILVFLPDYNGNAAELASYDRRLLSGISDYAFLNRGKLELRPDGDSAGRLLDQYRNLKFDGIIWERPAQKYNSVIEKLHCHNVPQVTISRTIGNVPSLFFDYKTGIQDVLHFLHSIGHRQIVFIDLPNPAPIFMDRRKVFEEELRKTGITDTRRFVYTMTFKDKNTGGINQVFSEHPDVTALFCCVPLIKEIWGRLQQRKCRIPEELSLITLGENQEYLNDDSIGSLCEPRSRIGWRAAELIRLQKSRRCIAGEPEFLAGELIIRKSCRSPLHFFSNNIAAAY